MRKAKRCELLVLATSIAKTHLERKGKEREDGEKGERRGGEEGALAIANA